MVRYSAKKVGYLPPAAPSAPPPAAPSTPAPAAPSTAPSAAPEKRLGLGLGGTLGDDVVGVGVGGQGKSGVAVSGVRSGPSGVVTPVVVEARVRGGVGVGPRVVEAGGVGHEAGIRLGLGHNGGEGRDEENLRKSSV